MKRRARRKRKVSAETRAKLSRAGKGRTISAKTRAKISRALKGRHFTDGHRAKLSRKAKKRTNTAAWKAQHSKVMKGCPVLPATRAKIGQTLKGRRFTAQHRARISRALKGHATSAATRAKIGEAKRGKPFSQAGRLNCGRSKRGERNPNYRHGAYVTPTQPVKTIDDLIADLSVKQGRLSALLDQYMDAGDPVSATVLGLFALHSRNAATLGRLLHYQQSHSDTSADELSRSIEQALEEIASEFGREV